MKAADCCNMYAAAYGIELASSNVTGLQAPFNAQPCTAILSTAWRMEVGERTLFPIRVTVKVGCWWKVIILAIDSSGVKVLWKSVWYYYRAENWANVPICLIWPFINTRSNICKEAKTPQILGSGTHMSLTKPTPHANCHLVHPAAWPQFTHTTNQLMDNQPTNQPWSYINDNNNKWSK